MKRASFFLCSVGVLLQVAVPGIAIAADGLAIVSGHTAIFKEPAKHVPTNGMVDGPLMGNGDVGVVVAGPPENQMFYVGKNDFWRRNDASVIAVGAVRLAMDSLAGASYQQEQDMAHAEVRGTFVKDGLTVHLTSWVDANQNLLVTEIRSDGKPLEISLTQASGQKGVHGSPHESTATISYARTADVRPGSRVVGVCSRVIGGEVTKSGESLAITCKPGQVVTIATEILSDLDTKDCETVSNERAIALKEADVAASHEKHQTWWASFWKKSLIEIPDKEIEKRWYAMLYVMASCSREGKVAPGLWGNWITSDHSNWHGDFHTNYNFQAPFYGVYAANHPEISLSFYQAMIEAIPEGKAMAQRHGWKGIELPVSIGPWDLRPEGPEHDWGQRSDAVFSAMNFIWEYQYTQDDDFLSKTGYPYLIEVANFWEDYLKLENGRYVIYSDSIHEGSGPDFNPLLSLGMVRTLFKNMIPMSKELGVDADRRAKWQDILDKLADYPTQVRNGKTVFRYTEKGMAWNNGNTLGIHHIYPAGAIGLDSDPKLLEISMNMLDAMHRWSDGNGFASWYAACARIGYDPETILQKMRIECDHKSYPNLVLTYGGGGIENTAGFGAINEMLLQSYEGVIRVFPCWPKSQPARFENLLGAGAFLVSSAIHDGVPESVTITSEKGRDCTVQNPWPGKKVQVSRANHAVERVEGVRFTLKTVAGETMTLKPE